MNQQTPDPWSELARMWKTDDVSGRVADIEELHRRQHFRMRIARAAELTCSMLGVLAAVWLALASRFLWVGILTVGFSVASVYYASRARRMPVPQGSVDLAESLKDSLVYLGWLAEQLRYGRMLGFVALFAVVIAASAQLMHLASVTRSELLATAAAGIAISAALAWNMTLAWQVWRRAARVRAFRAKLVTEHGPVESVE